MKLISGLAAVALAATTLAQPLFITGAAAATPAQAADAAGDWIAAEVPVALAAGDFAFYPGQLIDAGLGLAATDHLADARSVGDDLAPALATTAEYEYGYVKATEYDFETHANLGTGLYANPTAKAAAFTQRIGRNAATQYADVNLIAQLEGLTNDTTGRIADVSSYGDYGNTIGQAFAVEALANAGSSETAKATAALLAQQCGAGFFPLDLDEPCPTSQGQPDVTALAVISLVESGLTTPQVSDAIADAADWLESLQLANGSFPGEGGAAGANTNGTGLGGWALGEAGRTTAAAKAAAWTRALQVSDAGACASAAPTGAIAYNAADFASGRTSGLGTARNTWRIASYQAAPLLNWAPAASAPLAVATPATATDGATVTATVTGLAAGEYGCVTVGSSKRSVTGTGGPVTADFTLPAGAGSYTFTVTTLTESKTSTTTVPAPPTATPTPTPTATPTPARGSVTGVRLVGPTGFQRAGSQAALKVVGAAPGASYVLRGPGVDDATLVVGADGNLSRTVTLPDATTTASYVLFGSNGQVADDTRVLGERSLKVSTLAADGPRTRVLVRRLAPGEKVRVVVGGDVLAKGRANDKGRFVARVELPTDTAKVRVRATGQFPAIRSGETVVERR